MAYYILKHPDDVRPKDIPRIVNSFDAIDVLRAFRGTKHTFGDRTNLSETLSSGYRHRNVADFILRTSENHYEQHYRALDNDLSHGRLFLVLTNRNIEFPMFELKPGEPAHLLNSYEVSGKNFDDEAMCRANVLLRSLRRFSQYVEKAPAKLRKQQDKTVASALAAEALRNAKRDKSNPDDCRITEVVYQPLTDTFHAFTDIPYYELKRQQTKINEARNRLHEFLLEHKGEKRLNTHEKNRNAKLRQKVQEALSKVLKGDSNNLVEVVHVMQEKLWGYCHKDVLTQDGVIHVTREEAEAIHKQHPNWLFSQALKEAIKQKDSSIDLEDIFIWCL